MARSIAVTWSETGVVVASQISSTGLSSVSLPHCGPTAVGSALMRELLLHRSLKALLKVLERTAYG